VRPADGLYYHVDILRRAGLFVAVPGGRSHAGRSERRYRTPAGPAPSSGWSISRAFRATSPRYAMWSAACCDRTPRLRPRVRRRRRDRGSARELWAARSTGWVSDAELAEINRLLGRLSRLLRQPRGGNRQRLISLCFVLAPMTAPPHPALHRHAAAPCPPATTSPHAQAIAVIAAPHGLEALALVMRYILLVNDHVDREALHALVERQVGTEAKDAIVTVGERLIEQGRLQGLEQGVQRGSQQGKREMLLSLLRRRFGAAVGLDAERRLANASALQLETWADRVFSAATLSELLAD